MSELSPPKSRIHSPASPKPACRAQPVRLIQCLPDRRERVFLFIACYGRFAGALSGLRQSFYGRCCLRAIVPWPQNEEDELSSTPKKTYLLAQIRSMLRRVVDDGGYAPSASMNGRSVLLVATSLLAKLHRAGTPPSHLESALRERLREVMPPRELRLTALHRYAVQGLPRAL